MRRTGPVVLAVLLAGVLVGGAVGVIVGASTATEVHACVQPTTNLMRYTTGTCNAGEQLVTWNVTGPQGPTGPAGKDGASADGAMHFYEAKGTQHVTLLTPVVQLDLPAGLYRLEAEGLAAIPFKAGTIQFGSGFCFLTTNVHDDGNATGTIDRTPVIFASGGLVMPDLFGYVQMDAPGTVYGICTAPADASVTLTITATVAERLPTP